MQARSSRWAMGMGTGSGGGRGRGRGLVCATSFLGLWATINHARGVSSLSSGTNCPTEGIICATDDVCSVCIDTLRSLSASSLGFGSTSLDCDELLFNLCTVVDETVCDHSNEKFLALAACTVEDATGCTGFSSCAEVFSDFSPASSDLATGKNASAVPTDSPTAVPLTGSPSATTTVAPSGLEEVAEAADASTSGIGLTAPSVISTVGVTLICGIGLVFAM